MASPKISFWLIWPYVDGFDLSKAEKIELIHTMWAFSGGFVDRALGDDPVQMALNEQDDKRALTSGPVIEFEKVADGIFGGAIDQREREGE